MAPAQASRSSVPGMAKPALIAKLTCQDGKRDEAVAAFGQMFDHVKANEPGPVIQPDEQQRLFAQVRARARAGDLWILSGSLPRGVPASIYAAIWLARTKGWLQWQVYLQGSCH